MTTTVFVDQAKDTGRKSGEREERETGVEGECYMLRALGNWENSRAQE